ncbi:tetratricopeptide repeat protein [Candidatus Riflebacteria bacterium]
MKKRSIRSLTFFYSFFCLILFLTGCQSEEERLNNQGNYFFNQGNFQKAREYYLLALKGISANPGKKQELKFALNYNLGNVYYKLQDFESSLTYFVQAKKVNSQDPDLLYNLSCLLVSMNKTVRATKFLEKYLKLKPDDYQARVNYMTLKKYATVFSDAKSVDGRTRSFFKFQSDLAMKNTGILPLENLFQKDSLLGPQTRNK